MFICCHWKVITIVCLLLYRMENKLQPWICWTFYQGRASWDKKELFEPRRRAFIWESILTHTERPPAVLPGTHKLRCTQATIEQIHGSPPGMLLNTKNKKGFVLPWRSVKVKFTVHHTLPGLLLRQSEHKLTCRCVLIFVTASCQWCFII